MPTEIELAERLMQAEETLRAIRAGEVDALVVSNGAPGEQVYTLTSADRPYRIFVENMQEGAATLSASGTVLFANQRLSLLLGAPTSAIVARDLLDFIAEPSRPHLLAALGSGDGSTLELELLRTDGGLIRALVGISRLDVDGELLSCLTFADLTAEHALHDAVRAGQHRYEALYQGTPVPAFTWQDGVGGPVLIDHNEAAELLTEGLVVASAGAVAADFYRNEPDLLADLSRCLAEQVVVERETVRHSAATQREQHLQVTMVPVPPDLVVVHTHDITERLVAENALRASEARYRTIVENAQEGISILDADGVFTFANRRTAELLEHDVDTLRGMKAADLLGPTFPHSALSRDAKARAQFAVVAKRPNGTSIDLLVSTAPIAMSDAQIGWLCMISDVSGLRHAEEELAHWALHDVLTGLPNRTLLLDRIGQALNRGRRQTGTVAVLFCDLDGFKDVNDSFGHDVGDEVLQAAAARLNMAVRPGDTVARIGGDEFVVLCDNMVDETAAFGLASRVLLSLAEPLEVAGHEIALSVSIGVAFAFSGDSAELLRNADAAMYLAKQRGRNRAELFNEELRQVAADRIGMIADLRHAVERDELRVHYQPVFSLDGEDLLGVEALVRWQHPTRGLLFPDEFISAAESAGLIGDIGAWVLQASCQQAALWSHAGRDGAALHMAVNVSARQLAQGSGLVQLVADALDAAGVDPFTLVLEVTESVAMDDPEATLEILTELKALGVRLAIDDFGTGYSSLVYLKRFPVDQLKVDRSFVNGLGQDSDDTAIVASVVGLAHAVGIVAVAEGVETSEQLSALQGLGCALGQGYLWSKPCPASELEAAMSSGAFATEHSAQLRLPRPQLPGRVEPRVTLALVPKQSDAAAQQESSGG